MLQIKCTAKKRQALLYQVFHHPHPHVQKKMHVVYMRSQGFSQADIMKAVGIRSKTTITGYCREYRVGGIKKLLELRFNKPVSALKSFETDLKKHFKQHPPRSVKEAMAEIQKVTGIARKKSFVCDFMVQMGMRFRKVGSIPAKADIPRQKEFKKNYWILA